MEEQVTEVDKVIITNNNLLFHFSAGHNNDWLLLKQWKGA